MKAKETFSVVYGPKNSETGVDDGLTLAAAIKLANSEAKTHLVSYKVKNEKGKVVYRVSTVLEKA